MAFLIATHPTDLWASNRWSEHLRCCAELLLPSLLAGSIDPLGGQPGGQVVLKHTTTKEKSSLLL